MEQLIKMVAENTGISEDAAKTAVETVINFLKDKLPEPIDSQLDAILSGEILDKGGFLDKIKGLFGGN